MNLYRKYFIRIYAFLLLIFAFIFYNSSKVEVGFFHNPELNSVIIIIFIIGVFFSIRNVLLLNNDHNIINELFSNNTSSSKGPKIINDLYEKLLEKENFYNNETIDKSLEKLAFRLDSDREINKYLIAVLVFLGLLGTFWGLLATIESVGDTISNLSVEEEDILTTFLILKEGLKNPMSGMGTAFSSSLFGLSSSLCLGFIDLQLSRAQNEFLSKVDKKLSNNTKTNKMSLPEGGSIYIEALLAQTVEGLQKMSELFEKNESNRKSLEQIITNSINTLSKINDEIDFRLNQSNQTAISNLEHIRNIDNSLLLIRDNLKNNSFVTTEELSKEIKLLAKTISLIKK